MSHLRKIGFGLGVFALCGCGPSQRLVQKGSHYFESCLEADRQQSIDATEKLRCWQMWLRYYRKGQPDRQILYAEKRRDELATGFTLPIEAVVESDKSEPLPLESLAAEKQTPPEHPCKAVCDAEFDHCVALCAGHPSCDDTCDTEKNRCLAGCF